MSSQEVRYLSMKCALPQSTIVSCVALVVVVAGCAGRLSAQNEAYTWVLD